MSCTAEALLSLAGHEIGVQEDTRGYVRYNRDYYGKDVRGATHPWCCVFLWDLFRLAGASELFFGGGKTAYCPTLLSYHKAQRVTDYRPGDVIFFNFSGKQSAAHVGLCRDWDGSYITTIDGNTGVTNDAAGGRVMLRRRHRKYIVGAYRPAYEEDEAMTQEQFDAMLEDYLARQAQKPGSSWSRMAEAKALGYTDGTRPQSFTTREEVATMLVNALK